MDIGIIIENISQLGNSIIGNIGYRFNAIIGFISFILTLIGVYIAYLALPQKYKEKLESVLPQMKKQIQWDDVEIFFSEIGASFNSPPYFQRKLKKLFIFYSIPPARPST